jgi:hypothetical protein
VLESTTSALPADFAATDMMHRRVPLLHRFQLVLGESNVLIKTDSQLINAALGSCARSSDPLDNDYDAVWEIAVEVQNQSALLPGWRETDGFEIYSFGSSRSLRLDGGSWFAHTPPLLSGVGFVMISGDESCQIRQLARFLDKIMLFFGDNESRPNSFTEREVHA